MAKAKTKARTKAKARVEVKEEVMEEPKAELPPEEDSIIARVYLERNTGLEIVEWPDAEEHIKAIYKASGGDDRDFIFYEQDGTPVYMAVMNGRYSKLQFPQPGNQSGQAGMTSMELYSKGVTLAEGVEKIIELETQPKPSLIDQARKIMTPTIVIVACVIAIFLIIAMMKG